MSKKPRIELVQVSFAFRVRGEYFKCFHGARSGTVEIERDDDLVYASYSTFKKLRTSRDMFISILSRQDRGF